MIAIDKLRLRVQRYRGSNAELARAAQITSEWVRRFKAGDFDNPGIVTIERVSAALDVLEREQREGGQ